ncbi:Protein FAR1-RELATED SEQUENCE [Arachis hypogaea]|nr:Protein FAR1-RELATED SEQUENCE [Arachis hypogaea]
MVEKFGVADKKWVQDMYERRHSWATAHIRGKFFAGFRTTSRCEGLHAVISRYIKSRYSYTEFLRHFHRCLMFVRAKELEADFECAKGDPVMTTNLKQLERSAAENYTRAIFYLFVPILDRACAMRVVNSEDNGSYFIHTVSRYGTPGKDWRVVTTSDTREVRCTCMRMECFGVPCEHIIAMLVLNNVHEIPRSLILPRWTKDAKLVAVQSMGVIWDSVQLTQHWCLMDWYRKVCKIACHNTEKFQFARDIAMLMLKHFENEDAGDTSFPPEGPPTEGGSGPARNPPRRNTKGNGAHGGKKIQRCRLCREVGHNRTTFPDRRTMESSNAVADDMDSMDTDMVVSSMITYPAICMRPPRFLRSNAPIVTRRLGFLRHDCVLQRTVYMSSTLKQVFAMLAFVDGCLLKKLSSSASLQQTFGTGYVLYYLVCSLENPCGSIAVLKFFVKDHGFWM